MGTSHYQCNVALPTFNDDGPFAMWLWAVIVSIYLSMKSAVPGATNPCSSKGLRLYKPCEVPRPPRSSPHHSEVLLPLMMNVSYVGLCSCEGHVVVQRYGCSKVPTSISQTLVLFNVSAALRSLLMAPSNPPSCKKHVRRTHPTVVKLNVCVCVCARAVQACQAVLSPWSSQSHWTLNSYLLPSNKDWCHTSSCPISTRCLKEGGMRSWETCPTWQKLIDNLYSV